MSHPILFRFLSSIYSPILQQTCSNRELINTSRTLTSGLWRTMSRTAAVRSSSSNRLLDWQLQLQQQQQQQIQLPSLVSIARRLYATVENSSNSTTSTQILSKLFPQTSLEIDNEELRERRRREEEEEAQELERAWNRMKFGFGIFSLSSLAISIWAIYYFGRPKIDDLGHIVPDDFTNMPVVRQYIQRTWSSLNSLQKFIQEPSSAKLLPDVLKPPYIQPPYTLVLELKDVLIHPDWTYETGWRFKKRPGVDQFLRECSKHFEIVVFTAEQGITVFPLLDALDPNGYIMYRLVRDSTHFVDGHHVKNLDNLNRDLRRVVVLDWDKNATKLHPNNVFNIPRWEGNDNDATLYDLISFLSVLGSSEVDDVRDVLHYYMQFSDPIAQFRENQRKLMEQMEQRERETKSKTKPIVRKWARNFSNTQTSKPICKSMD